MVMGYDAEGSKDFRKPEWTINVWSNGLDYEVIKLQDYWDDNSFETA